MNITDKSAVMLEIIEEFCDGFKSSIVGKNRYIPKKVLVGSAQINVALDENLAQSLQAIVPENDLQDVEILTAISNSRGIEGSVLITEVNLLTHCKGELTLILIFVHEPSVPIKIWSATKFIALNSPHSDAPLQ